MDSKIEAFKKHVAELAVNPDFVHHKWFVKWHLEIVARIALELCDHYPQADRQLVEVMAWLHDYGKMVDYDNQYSATLTAGRKKLTELGFSPEFAEKAVSYIETMDKKLEIDLRKAPLEVQIVSSADGCSHLVGPFMHLFWHEATDATFHNMTLEGLMKLNRDKAMKDWNHKIVLPEAREAFAPRHKLILEQSGGLPARFV